MLFPKHLHSRAFAVLGGLALAGCLVGGGDKKEAGSKTAWEGIYRLNHSTENPSGCDVEGPSVLDQALEPYFAVINGKTFFGINVVSVIGCADTAECRQQVAEARQDGVNLFGLNFSEGSDAAGYKFDVTTAFSSDSVCEGTVSRQTMASPAQGVIRIERRNTNSTSFPRDAEGYCTTDDAARHALNQPCSEYAVKMATLAAGL